MTQIAPPKPLIDEPRARAVRVKGFAVAEKLLDVVDAQVCKLKEIADADLSLAEMIEQEGAIKALERQLANIPAMLEMAKEASHPLTKLVGILRSEAPIPGEPKAFCVTPSAVEPQDPPEPATLDELSDDVRQQVFAISERVKETKKKPRKKKTG